MFKAFKQNGLEEFFHGIKLKPGRPTMVGKMENTYVFALPGNPLSSYLNAIVLLIPALKKLSSATNFNHNFVIAKNKIPFKVNPKKSHLALGIYKDGFFEVYKNYKYGSGMVSALFNSNALALIDEGKEEIKNEEIKILLF